MSCPLFLCPFFWELLYSKFTPCKVHPSWSLYPSSSQIFSFISIFISSWRREIKGAEILTQVEFLLCNICSFIFRWKFILFCNLPPKASTEGSKHRKSSVLRSWDSTVVIFLQLRTAEERSLHTASLWTLRLHLHRFLKQAHSGSLCLKLEKNF